MEMMQLHSSPHQAPSVHTHLFRANSSAPGTIPPHWFFLCEGSVQTQHLPDTRSAAHNKVNSSGQEQHTKRCESRKFCACDKPKQPEPHQPRKSFFSSTCHTRSLDIQSTVLQLQCLSIHPPLELLRIYGSSIYREIAFLHNTATRCCH